MAIKSPEDLKKIKDEALEEATARINDGTQIMVGMGTCGIAAGAREVMAAIMEEVGKRNLKIAISWTGCIGMCEQEVLVDVIRPGEKRITYGKVTPQVVPRIITEHVINGNIVEDYVVGKLD
ncbi:MAG: (2Fe-2S) ferredoxin domain-containing protein [Bacillota bacterium]|jgi:NADP-reducing hydrogenase subunit HndB|nr:(2Fe-2S) ferredoxin domain-containing protein [Bacillota bacterium]HOC06086.1 (2Fe-2S) ferredoxin domain-containing protein [Bacillota bacterium]HPZ21607.1 (2Fe-2S) ferredoxin domain-containing protein [Bacillota bacterium]HQD19453.1 (2Fe-2S) ferredoxin domain-containing protein [Bacillota bacterium]